MQSEPTQGVPASEDTEVRLLFDSENLYVGILCRDRTPSAIVATQLARDAELDVDDHVTIVLDTFFDQRNGFFFVVNPAGARADGQISNNARELELDWDGIWDARTQITAEGWAAEVAIPFKTLRFKAGQTVWGLNVERQIKRLEEVSRWSSPGPDMWVANLATAGQLTGLAGIQQGFGLDVRPYVAGSRETDDERFKVGLDAFKGITPNLTASLTVNTDFAETEVDEREINLTRFGLFFPEKRSFFLEGTGTFDSQASALTTRMQISSRFLPARSGCSAVRRSRSFSVPRSLDDSQASTSASSTSRLATRCWRQARLLARTSWR